jgi:hypothetical protein
MLIVCTIKRAKGTHPKMPDDGTVYSFLPNAQGDHVCEVANIDHITRLLAIPSFEPYTAADAQVAADLDASSNELTEAEQEIKPELANDLNEMTLEELQAEYHYRFGKAAHPQTKHSTLVKKLAAARMEPSAE